MRLPQPKEADIERVCIQYLSLVLPSMILVRQGQQTRVNAKGRRFWPKNYRRGVTDYIAGYKGRFIAIEFKTGKGKLSDEQQQFQADVLRAQCAHIVLRSLKDAEALVKNLTA